MSHRSLLTRFVNIFNANELPSSLQTTTKSTTTSESTKTIAAATAANFCNICCTSSQSSQPLVMLSLDECGHSFCSHCWYMHFEHQIRFGGGGATSSSIECMQTKCKSVASKEFVLECLLNTALVSGGGDDERSALAARYKRLLAIDLINESDDIRMCPGEIRVAVAGSESTRSQRCNRIVWAKSEPSPRRVLCAECGTQYCFSCLMPYHAPNSCQIIRKWNIKCQDDSETRNYLLVHTQDCPKCKVCIEKNGGCSHMTCNRCKHEFCWGMYMFK